MAQTPKKRPTSKKRSPRSHIPALDSKSLRIALDELRALNVSDLVKQNVSDILKAAANPGHGKPGVIVRSLPKERQRMIEKTMKGVKEISDAVMTRGKQGLLNMSDDEWNNLVEQAD